MFPIVDTALAASSSATSRPNVIGGVRHLVCIAVGEVRSNVRWAHHDKAMHRISDNALDRLERKYAAGFTSSDLLLECAAHGLPLTESTLRKYVQLGLLPRSVRIGRKGKHKGSLGVYPARTIRQLARVKEMMSKSYTIQEIRSDFLFMRVDIEQLEETLSTIYRSLTEVLAERCRRGLLPVEKREVSSVRRQGERLVAQLTQLEYRLTSFEPKAARVGGGAGLASEAS